MLQLFDTAVKDCSLPDCVKSDKGCENIKVCLYEGEKF